MYHTPRGHTDITWDITYRVLSAYDICDIPGDIRMPIDLEIHACIYIYTGVFQSDRDVDRCVPDMAGLCDSYRLQSHGDVDCDEDVFL